MKVHTDKFKNQIKTLGREIDSKITYILNGELNTLTGEQLNSVTPSFQGNILKSVMKQLDIDSNIDIPIGTILNYKFGLLVDGVYEYLDFGNYIVYSSKKQEDYGSYKLICYDKLLYSMKKNEELEITYPITIRNYINAICTKLGLEFKNINDNFANYDKQISQELYLGLDYTYRDIFDELAEVTASTICIDKDDKVEIRYVSSTAIDTIDEEFLKDTNINFGQKYGPINSIVLSRSAESDNVYLKDEESVETNGLNEIKIIDNQIMNGNDRSDYLPDILGKLNGLEYYINDFVSTGITYYDLCDRYGVSIGNKTYSCVMFNDELLITQGIVENIYTEILESSQTDYSKADKTDRKINQTNLIVNKQKQEITALASKTDDLNTQTAQLRLDVDTIEGQISDIADITTTAEGTGTLVMENINESEPIYIKIYPKLGDITSLYPANDLYPADDLYPLDKTLIFHCTSETYDKTYELPKDLLWFNKDTYDEFVLDYDNQTCYILHRVAINESGEKYALANVVQENFEYPNIPLVSGDYEVSLLGQPNAYLYIRLMVQNLYTTQFATKVEMNSKITQTAKEINIEVGEKVGKEEVIARINLTKETATIQANKVNINGIINAVNNNTTTTINGNKITTGSITASQIQTGTITADKVASDVITTNNFSAQTINADNIKAGTLSASSISLKGTQLSPTYSKIGGWTVNDSELSSGNSTIKSNGVVGFYPQVQNGGILALNDGFRCKAPNGVAIYNTHTGYGNSTSVDNGIHLCADVGNLDLMTEHSSYGVNIRSYCSPSSISNAGSRSIRLAAGQNIAMYAVGGYCYAEGNGVASAKIKTDKGSASSKNVKKNLKKFNDKKYDSAINILKNMDLYEYDYKYDLYKDRHQYGFLIDELEKLDRNEFFNFEEEEAIVKGEHLDFNLENKTKKDKTIKVKKYDSDVLDKYLLTVVKALLNKIEILENKVEKMERKEEKNEKNYPKNIDMHS